MSKAARKQLGIQPEVVKNNDKHAVICTHELHISQDLMCQDPTSKHWYPAVIQSLCSEPRKLQDTYKRWYCLQKNPVLSEVIYTSETRTLNLLSVCYPQWHNLPICGQWNKLSTWSLIQWTITYKTDKQTKKGL